MLTIHGGTPHQTNYCTGPSDWNDIRQVVDVLEHSVSILAIGIIAFLKDVHKCLSTTNIAGVLSSEATLLEYLLFFCVELF